MARVGAAEVLAAALALGWLGCGSGSPGATGFAGIGGAAGGGAGMMGTAEVPPPTCSDATIDSPAAVAAYSSCLVIEGDVDIGGGVESLVGLERLVEIEGSLKVEDSRLVDFHGLGGLKKIGQDFIVEYNPSLESLVGLDALESVGAGPPDGSESTTFAITGNPVLGDAVVPSLAILEGELHVVSNRQLETLKLDAVTAVEVLRIDSNAKLVTLSMSSLTSVAGPATIADGRSLVSLGDFKKLATVGGTLEIHRVRRLADLEALSGLTSIQEKLFLADDDALASLGGLRSLTSLGGLDVQRCPALPQCQVDAFAMRLGVTCPTCDGNAPDACQ
jgi:hypothetical protein